VTQGINQPKTSLYYLFRSILYAFLALVALAAGYLIDTRSAHVVRDPQDVWLLLLYGLAAPFFVGYSSVFTRARDDSPRGDRDTFVYVLMGGLMLSAIGILVYRIRSNAWPPVGPVVSLTSLAVVFLLYGVYLLWFFDKATSPRARHQLVWSILLAIGLSLYVGLSLRSFFSSYRPLVPPAVLFVLIASSESFRKRRSLLIYISSFTALAVLIIWFQGMQAELLTMFFCVCVSAYVAVFEAWGATSSIVEEEGSRELGQRTFAGRYYNATLLALIVSGALFPAFYIFTRFTRWFLLAYAIHTIISLALWLWAGVDGRFRDYPWLLLKNIMGTVALVGLIVDAFARNHEVTVSATLMNAVTYAAVFGVTVFVLAPHAPKVWEEWGREGLAGLLSAPRRFIVVLLFFAVFGVFTSIEVYLSYASADQMIAGRARYACWLYIVYWIGALMYLGNDYRSPNRPQRGQNVLGALLGTLMLVRVFTSGIIGAMVTVPSVWAGRPGLWSLAQGLPFCFAAMGGFALNDILDVNCDAVNRPYRPLPKGALSVRAAWMITVVALFASVVTSIVVSRSRRELVFYAAALIGVIAYNAVVKHLGVCKGLFTALICAIPLLFLATEGLVGFYLPGAAAIYIWGRETLMDVFDMRGDGTSGRHTIPMVIGQRAASWVGFCLLYAAVLVIGSFGASDALLVILICWLALTGILWFSLGSLGKRWTVYLLWGPMLIVPATTLSGVLP
jgi:geranylgeranylglycerol-phosphate geranylgeranyltransferase